MTRGNTYGPLIHLLGTISFPLVSGQSFLDSFSSMHLKITLLDVFLKIIPVLRRKFELEKLQKKLTIHKPAL